jgi:NhaP-type Na+/H+ or K+/H+ antiporter
MCLFLTFELYFFAISIGNFLTIRRRIIIAIQCMACGIDLPGYVIRRTAQCTLWQFILIHLFRNYIWREKLSLFILLIPVTIGMWLMTAVGIYLILGLPFVSIRG